MDNLGETHPGDNRATWLLNVRVPSTSGDHEILLGDCRLDILVNETATTLRCAIKVEVPVDDIAERRARPGWSIPIGMDTGVFVLSCPLPFADRGREIAVAVRMIPARIELFVDGVLVDEEWPWTPLRSDGPVTVRSASGMVNHAAFFNRDLSDPELRERAPAPDPSRATALLGVEEPFPQYWRPRGHNTTAGDVMLCVHKDELHLFYLFDRRRHASKWMSGAHQFYHMSSADLRTWKHLPPAIPIEEPWEAIGTGTCISDGERMSLFYEQHGERFLAGRKHRGMWLATSDDGVHFKKHQARCPEIVQPGAFKAADAPGWNIVSGQKRFTSTDLKHWTCVETDFLPALPGMSDECPCYFSFGQWHYIAIGRTGFFMSRNQSGPYWNKPGSNAPMKATASAWDIYDGLMVPSIVAFKGRLILAGWVYSFLGAGWGGVLVVRELEQRADGNLYLRWLPELIPDGGEWKPVELDRSRHAALPVPASSSFHIKLEAKPSDDLAPFSIVLGDFNSEQALELRFEPRQRRIQWGTASQGQRAPESRGVAADAGDFAIQNVEGMERPFNVELIVKRLPTGTVVDAAFSFGRTMITRRGTTELSTFHVLTDDEKATVGNVFVRTIA